MFKLTSKFLALGLTATVLLITGCGGGGSSDDTLTKAEFIEKAEALCREWDKREAGEYNAWARQNINLFNGSPDGGLEKGLRVILVPSIRNLVEKLKALGTPEEDKAQLEKFFDEVEIGLEKMEEDPLSANDRRPLTPFFPSYLVGKAYGFDECREVY